MKSSSVIIAVKTGNNKKLKALIEEKADVNITDADGVSALTWAAQVGLSDVVKTLIENKASIDYADKEALKMAIRCKNADIVDLLKTDTSTQSKKIKMVDNKLNKDSISTLSFSLARMLKDTEKQLTQCKEKERKRNPKAAKDLANMFAHLLDLDNTKEFNNIDYKVTSGKLFRTTNAHYRHTDFRVKREEGICRTTITASEFPVKYIEYRTTPEMDLGEESNGSSYRSIEATHQWIIAFRTKENAAKYGKLISHFSPYNPHLFNKTIDFSNVFYISLKTIDRTLHTLVEKGCCPEEAINNQKKQLEERSCLSFSL